MRVHVRWKCQPADAVTGISRTRTAPHTAASTGRARTRRRSSALTLLSQTIPPRPTCGASTVERFSCAVVSKPPASDATTCRAPTRAQCRACRRYLSTSAHRPSRRTRLPRAICETSRRRLRQKKHSRIFGGLAERDHQAAERLLAHARLPPRPRRPRDYGLRLLTVHVVNATQRLC